MNTETLESIAVPLCSNGEMLRLFAAVPGQKYSHDTGNPVVAMEDSAATYELFKDRVAAVHFKDLEYTEEKTEMMDPLGRYLRRAELGEGVIDFKAHLQMLKRDGYTENEITGNKGLTWEARTAAEAQMRTSSAPVMDFAAARGEEDSFTQHSAQRRN